MTVEIISWSISTKVWDRVGIELATPGSAVRFASVAKHVTDCATRPGNLLNTWPEDRLGYYEWGQFPGEACWSCFPWWILTRIARSLYRSSIVGSSFFSVKRMFYRISCSLERSTDSWGCFCGLPKHWHIRCMLNGMLTVFPSRWSDTFPMLVWLACKLSLL